MFINADWKCGENDWGEDVGEGEVLTDEEEILWSTSVIWESWGDRQGEAFSARLRLKKCSLCIQL